MANGNAAGNISNISATTIAGINPTDPVKNALERRAKDEDTYAQMGIFSPLGVLRNVMGDVPQETLNKWRSASLKDMHKVPVAVGYALYGNLYPHLIQYDQTRLTNMAKRYGVEKDSMTLTVGDKRKELLKQYAEAKKNNKEGDFMKSLLSYGGENDKTRIVRVYDGALLEAAKKYKDTPNKENRTHLTNMRKIRDKIYNLYGNNLRETALSENPSGLMQAADAKNALVDLIDRRGVVNDITGNVLSGKTKFDKSYNVVMNQILGQAKNTFTDSKYIDSDDKTAMGMIRSFANIVTGGIPEKFGGDYGYVANRIKEAYPKGRPVGAYSGVVKKPGNDDSIYSVTPTPTLIPTLLEPKPTKVKTN